MPINTGTAIRELEIGPFSGGINTYSDAAMISDDEMVDCVNFDMALDGSLKSRPPWGTLFATKLVGTSNQECNQNVIGTGVFENSRFIIYNSNHIANAYASYIYYVDGPNAGITAKIGDGVHTKAHRYGGFMYLVPDLGAFSAGKGLKYNLDTGAVTLIATMPQGYASIVYKDRLWISGRKGVTDETASRLYFSELADFSLPWPGTNFFDINPGDGDDVNDLAVYQDNILVFKDNATYVLTYDTGPAQAVLQVINTTVGSMGRYCVAAYENSIFILQYNKVYEMSNYDFTRISVKIPFDFDKTVPSQAPYLVTGQDWKFPMWLRNVGDRLYVRFWNRVYIYHLRLRAWTRFDSLDPNVKYIGPVMELDNTSVLTKLGFETYVAGSSLLKNIDASGSGGTQIYNKILKMEDRYENVNIENGEVTPLIPSVDIKLMYLGKQYDIGVSHRFKRLMHWGVDCFTKRTVTGTLIPFTVTYDVTWEQLESTFWHDLNTWTQPLIITPKVVQTVNATGAGDQTKFIRFPKSVRFRLLQFQVDMETKGNLTDGPVFIYSVTAFVGGKQLVPKAVN